jgi:simple sugar transport system permease protein
MTNKKVREPLFQVSKRGEMPLWKAIVIRATAVIGALLLVSVLCGIIFSGNPLEVIEYLFDGVFGTKRRIWNLLKDLSLLLLVGLALVPAFKMKFWNLGGNGQILMGALVTAAIMRGNVAVSSPILANVLMVVCAILAGAVWAVIPAIFKAFFKTNESLFTLMMNYIAAGLVSYFVFKWAPPSSSGTLGILPNGHLPEIYNRNLLTIIVAVLVVVGMFFYIKHSKHGYEISVVGESEKTASYAGMNVKKVIIRTLAISGGICGLVGLLLVGSINFTLNKTIDGNMGFIAIMVAWLGKFNPFMMIATTFLVVFLTRGMAQVQTEFGIANNSTSNMLIAIVYFIIIACEFFIVYKIKLRVKKSKPVGDFISPQVERDKQNTKEDK